MGIFGSALNAVCKNVDTPLNGLYTPMHALRHESDEILAMETVPLRQLREGPSRRQASGRP